MFNLPTFQQFNTYINKLQTEYDFIEKCYDVELEGFIEHFTSFETAVDLLQFIFNDDCNILAIWIYEDNFGRDKHHSFMNNKITLVKGPAGAGKSLLSLGFLLQQLDKNAIDKIIIFCNTVATRDSARLGFYPGTRDEKLLDSQIGNFLSSKLGSQIEVERMIQNEQLILLPMSDIRGYDTSDMKAGIYIPEAQNLTIDLMKLALQRIGEDGICIIDGDDKAQVDCQQYEGSNNGMRRVSKIFKGESIYGEVELQNIHRSQIGKIADKM